MQIILFHKPFNVLCQFTDRGKRVNLGDYLTVPGMYAAGRLDYDSEGLLVLTDTGRIQKRITDPGAKLPKTYWVQVEGAIGENTLNDLARSIQDIDGRSGTVSVELITPSAAKTRNAPFAKRLHPETKWLAITVTDERSLQIRKGTAAVGLTTVRLIRQSVGPWQLGKLQPGEWKVATIPSGWLEQSEGAELIEESGLLQGERVEP